MWQAHFRTWHSEGDIPLVSNRSAGYNNSEKQDDTIKILLLHHPTSECCPDCHVSNGDVIPDHKGAKGEVRVDVRARSLELGSVGEDGGVLQPFVHLSVSDRSAAGQD